MLLCMVALFSCGSEPTNGPVIAEFHTFLDKHVGHMARKRTQVVVNLTERGCVGCNRALADLVQRHLGDSSLVLILGATGQNIDISPFLSGQGSLIEDRSGLMHGMGFPEGSCAILLKDGELDTVVHLDASGIGSSLKFIESRLVPPDDQTEGE